MDVHQFATSLTYGDAISDEMLEIQGVLRTQGHRSEIFVRQFDPRSAAAVKDYREYPNWSDPKNVVIFHFSIGSPVSKMFLRIPDRKMMIYHNITPAEFFLDSHRVLTRECHRGRLEIAMFVDKVDLALGDSDFNRRELAEVGYKKTGVLPILMNFDKFQGPGDPITRALYETNKTTLLYVGRVIPNKKFEDLVKVFYFYKKHFNPEARLILAGDYRGQERYLAGLQALIAELRVTDVHLTGHVEFPELLAYYRIADYYLSLSEHEGFGVPLLEAFHLGLPVIGYAAGAVEETMNGGGVVLHEKDFLRTAGLIDAIERDPSLRKHLIDGQRKALTPFLRENVSKVLLDQVAKVAAG
jgi:glycosyltransferase involved in cell wall biosynthesis